MSEFTTMMTPDLVYIVYSIGVGTYLREKARAVPLKSGTAQLGLSRPTFWKKNHNIL